MQHLEETKTRHLTKHWFLIGCLLVLTGVAVAFGGGSDVGQAQPAAISADTAIVQALRFARAGGPTGKLTGPATEIRGQLMSYAQAHQLRHGEPLNPATGVARLANQSVWFFALRGEIGGQVPGSPDGRVPPKTVWYTQMVLIIDATTGELMGGSMRSPGRELDVTSLQVLAEPRGPVPPPPTRAPTVPPAQRPSPVPTKPAAPPAPGRQPTGERHEWTQNGHSAR